jgi:hypothetical protein
VRPFFAALLQTLFSSMSFIQIAEQTWLPDAVSDTNQKVKQKAAIEKGVGTDSLHITLKASLSLWRTAPADHQFAPFASLSSTFRNAVYPPLNFTAFAVSAFANSALIVRSAERPKVFDLASN